MTRLSAPLPAAIKNSSKDKPLSISTLIMSLRGSTQPKLVLCSDKRLYVLKMHANPSGPNALANEFIGTSLLKGLGFEAPPHRLISIDQATLDNHPSLTLTARDGRVYKPNPGLHVATEYVEGFTTEGGRRGSTLSAEFLGVGLFDIWAAQCDSRQYVHSYDPTRRRLTKLFIDNASLFGGANWQNVGLYDKPAHASLPRLDHSTYKGRIESWIGHFQSRIPGLLQTALGEVIPDWYGGNLDALESDLLRRLADLPHLVSQALEPNSYRRLIAFEAHDCSYGDPLHR